MLMEGPLVKYMIILILLFDGTLVREAHEFTKPVTVLECLSYADDHREAIAQYMDIGINQGWYLKDNRGTWQGVICDNKK